MSVPVCVVCVCVGRGEIVRNGNGEGNTYIFLTGPDDTLWFSWLKYESNFWLKKKKSLKKNSLYMSSIPLQEPVRLELNKERWFNSLVSNSKIWF